MDLLELLRQEITALHFSSPLVIARYIYIRIAELFEYDPYYNVADERDSKIIREKTIDIRNVESFHLICYSWAKMYHELLTEFGISSRIVHDFCHDYVEISIHDRKITADMTKDYQDISYIKFGMKKHHNFYIGSPQNEQKEINYADKILKYLSSISMEEVIELLKNELLEENDNVFDYCRNAMKAIEQIMSVQRKNVGYISGKKFIKYLLINLIKKFCSYQIYEFFNREEQTYIEAFIVEINGIQYYYTYQKMADGCYELHEVTKNIIDFLFHSNSFEYKKNYTQIHSSDFLDVFYDEKNSRSSFK